MINIGLMRLASEEHAFNGTTFRCPECQSIEDDQYFCCLCESSPQTDFSVAKIITSLLTEIDGGEQSDYLKLIQEAIKADHLSQKYFHCPSCEFDEPQKGTCEVCWGEGAGNFFNLEDGLLFLVGKVNEIRAKAQNEAKS